MFHLSPDCVIGVLGVLQERAARYLGVTGVAISREIEWE